MSGYRSAWEGLDSAKIVALFSASGRYRRLSPTDKSVAYEQLPSLWNQMATDQRENFLDFDLVDVAADHAYVLWRCLTTNSETRARRLGFGVFALRLDGFTCSELLEWDRWGSTLSNAPPMPLGKMRAAIRHLEDKLGERITLSQAARSARLSSRHASRLFRVFTGQSLHQYVIQQRLALARERLAWTQEPIVDLAYELGFANQAHFINTFKTATTFTPTQFRARFAERDDTAAGRWLGRIAEALRPDRPRETARCLKMPDDHRALADDAQARRWFGNLSVDVLTATPSTVLARWALPAPDGNGPERGGHGMLLLRLASDGSCRTMENCGYWH